MYVQFLSASNIVAVLFTILKFKVKVILFNPIAFCFSNTHYPPPRVYSVFPVKFQCTYTHIHTYTLQKFTANILSRFLSLLMKDDYVRFFRSLELFFAAVLQFFSLHNHLCSYTCHQHAVQKHFPVNLPVSVFHGFFFLSFYCLLLVFCIVLYFFSFVFLKVSSSVQLTVSAGTGSHFSDRQSA